MEERISKLPEHILQDILSRLDIKEATRACGLCKAWFSAWQTRPILRFVQHEFYYGLNQDSEKVCREKFFNYVSSTLHRYQAQKISIQSFKLESLEDPDNCEDCDWVSLFNSWIRVAVECSTKGLELYCDSYTIPQIVFEAKSLEHLSAIGSNGSNLKLQVPENISCFRLKNLYLNQLYSDEVTLHNILSSCHRIEFLELDGVVGIENLKLVSFRNLKHLHVSFSEYKSIEVEAPNLEWFCCGSGVYGMDNPCMLNLRASQNLKYLKLFNMGITDMLFYDFNHKFPKLEDLIIQSCPDLKCLKISSQLLRHLVLERCHALKELWVESLNLVRVTYAARIIPTVFLTNSSRCWVSEISLLYLENIVDSTWFRKLKEFLRSLIPSKISLCIHFTSRTCFSFEEVTDHLAFPEPHVHELSFHGINWSPIPSDFSTILDWIFWICRPTLIKRYTDPYSNIEFTKFLVKKLTVERNQDYYDSQGIKSWERDLKEAKVEFREWNEEAGWKPTALDRETFLNMSFTDHMLICFCLDWGKSSYA